MPLSIYKQIVDTIVTRLQGIVGDGGATFWYTPNAVYAVSWISELALKADKQVLYLLVPDDLENEELTFTTTLGRARLDLAACRRYERPGDDPASSQETRWNVQSKLEQDAKKRLRTALTVGGLELHTEIPISDFSAENTYDPGWAVVFMHLEIQFTHTDGTP